MARDSIYTKAVEISEEYLGPAGERFLRRQIDTHLGIEPEMLKRVHMPKLTQWTELAFSLLTNDRHEVTSYTNHLLSLGAQEATRNEKTR